MVQKTSRAPARRSTPPAHRTQFYSLGANRTDVSVHHDWAGSHKPVPGVSMEILIIGLSALLCGATYLLYRVATSLQERK